jgi:hypothetical protein
VAPKDRPGTVTGPEGVSLTHVSRPPLHASIAECSSVNSPAPPFVTVAQEIANAGATADPAFAATTGTIRAPLTLPEGWQVYDLSHALAGKGENVWSAA